MTPTETSATTTPLLPGRDLDVAVARAMSIKTFMYKGEPYMQGDGDAVAVPLHAFSTDDATALRWGVPWLRAREAITSITDYPTGRVTVCVSLPGIGVVANKTGCGDNALAAALCQVIVAVSKESRNG